jgi:hypothetical protein
MPPFTLHLGSGLQAELDARDLDQAIETITTHRASGMWLHVGPNSPARVDPHAVKIVTPATPAEGTKTLRMMV